MLYKPSNIIGFFSPCESHPVGFDTPPPRMPQSCCPRWSISPFSWFVSRTLWWLRPPSGWRATSLWSDYHGSTFAPPTASSSPAWFGAPMNAAFICNQWWENRNLLDFAVKSRNTFPKFPRRTHPMKQKARFCSCASSSLMKQARFSVGLFWGAPLFQIGCHSELIFRHAPGIWCGTLGLRDCGTAAHWMVNIFAGNP